MTCLVFLTVLSWVCVFLHARDVFTLHLKFWCLAKFLLSVNVTGQGYFGTATANGQDGCILDEMGTTVLLDGAVCCKEPK